LLAVAIATTSVASAAFRATGDGIYDAVVLTKLIERGVPDDEATEHAFVMAEEVFQGMLERGWAAMAPTLDERYDDRLVGFVDGAQ
jgi:hypothetical protein